MAEIHSNGYVSIREHIVANWKKVVLKDASDNQIFSTTIDGKKARWAHTRTTEQRIVGRNEFGEPIYDEVQVESNPVLEILLTLTGADVSLPATVTKVQVLDDTQNRIMTEEIFTPFTFKTAQDDLTLSVKIQVPSRQ